MTLLLQRKQKLLIPYIYSEDSNIIKFLLEHVYQKSISELLNKIVSVMDVEFDSPTKEIIQAKQKEVVAALITKLGPTDTTEDDNLNASSIL